ncbi:endoplasmic oxidoreductin-1 [Orbilia oligospora]|uniref:Endoplasmic oxidoreductin-1 n=1 Tax=Orbilia oligospora TaxID=2813651 RepID=A0A8H2DV41_ORBOL|nr:endoplasmic oxidoreductin-1 [Orbilia oligospora]TGJ66806.1 endoplasmic oxidoreductin-1 [Orbilia oligospora]
MSTRRSHRHAARWFFLGYLATAAYGAVDKDLSYCSNEPNSLVSDACVSYATLEEINTEVRPAIQFLTQNVDFFTYYRLDLYGRECPFWSDDAGFCANRACAVELADEKDIPESWRSSELGKLEGPKASQPSPEVQKEEPSPFKGTLGEDTAESCIFEPQERDNRDYCVAEDEGNGSNCVYVSLIDNPERFTGYAGTSANNVWKAVYQENCFNTQAQAEKQSSNQPFGGAFGRGIPADPNAAANLKNVMDRRKHEVVQKNLISPPPEEQCLEKRVFYRVLSGMHASISMHLCHDFFNQTTGQWGPNLQCYKDRLHNFPDRIQNMYFNYAILLRAVAKLRKNLNYYTFCAGDKRTNEFTRKKLSALTDRIASHPSVFDESVMFKDENSLVLKEDFRNRFRNVSRLMDCVGCDKCRLWGKLQTSGYGTALKILFEYDENEENGKNPILRRTELVALINTLGRLSNSLYAFTRFGAMIERERVIEEMRAQDAFVQLEKEAERERKKKEAEAQSEENVLRWPEQPELTGNESVKELFMRELEMVWFAFRFIAKSWYDLPLKAWRIYRWGSAVMMDKFLGRDRYQTRVFPYRHALDEL